MVIVLHNSYIESTIIHVSHCRRHDFLFKQFHNVTDIIFCKFLSNYPKTMLILYHFEKYRHFKEVLVSVPY